MPDRLDRAARVMETVSDVVVGVGPTSTEALVRSGLAREKTRTILNAVDVAPARTRADVRAELGFDESTELIVNVGRYAPEKNQPLLAAAVVELAARRPTVRAVFCGGGDPHLIADVHTAVERAGASELVLLAGERRDAADIVAASDVFCLSSDSEGLPLALLEAMSLGTPVVSTDAGGVRDAIQDGETGLLTPIGDQQALAAALERVLADEELRARLVENGRAFVARTSSVAAMTDAYEHLYDELVERRRPATRRTGASPST